MDAPILVDRQRLDTRCSLEGLPRTIDDRDGWRQRERGLEDFVLSAQYDDDDFQNSRFSNEDLEHSRRLLLFQQLLLDNHNFICDLVISIVYKFFWKASITFIKYI